MLIKFATSKRFEELSRIEPQKLLQMSADIKHQLQVYLSLKRAAERKARAA
jgi:hypothetical protein